MLSCFFLSDYFFAGFSKGLQKDQFLLVPGYYINLLRLIPQCLKSHIVRFMCKMSNFFNFFFRKSVFELFLIFLFRREDGCVILISIER